MKRIIAVLSFVIGMWALMMPASASEKKYKDYEKFEDAVNKIMAASVDDIVFSSSDESVAVIDENGRVTGVGVGTATVYAYYKNGIEGYNRASCTVTVSKADEQPNPENPAVSDNDISYVDGIKIADSYSDEIRTSINDATVTYKNSYPYTGQRVFPKVTVKMGKTVLTEGTDYTVTYKNNVEVTNDKKAEIIVSGNGLYKDGFSKEFTIEPKPVKKLKAYADTFTVGGVPENIQDKIYVFDGSKLLQKDVDYTVKLPTAGFDKKGSVKATIEGATGSNYTGAMTVNIPVIALKDSEKLITSVEYKNAGEEKNRYTGKALKYTVNDFEVKTAGGEVVPSIDYTVSVKNTKDAGYGMATIKGKGKVFKGAVNVPVRIYPTQAAFDATVKSPVVYNGKLQRQKPKVTSALGNLKEGKDYIIVYRDNLYAGEASVEITGIGNYEGQRLTKTFTINQLDIKKTCIKKDKNGNMTVTYNKHQLVEGVDYDLEDTILNGKPAKLIKGRRNFNGIVVK